MQYNLSQPDIQVEAIVKNEPADYSDYDSDVEILDNSSEIPIAIEDDPNTEELFADMRSSGESIIDTVEHNMSIMFSESLNNESLNNELAAASIEASAEPYKGEIPVVSFQYSMF